MAMTTTVRGADILIFVNTGSDASPVWTPVGGQQNATLSEERETVETSNKNSDGQAREFEYGFYQWTIEAEGVYVPNDGAWNILRNAIRNAQKVLVRVKENGAYTLQGLGLVVSQETEAPYDDSTTYSLEIQGSGPLNANPA